jgi:Mg-chelatase subunit ChlD
MNIMIDRFNKRCAAPLVVAFSLVALAAACSATNDDKRSSTGASGGMDGAGGAGGAFGSGGTLSVGSGGGGGIEQCHVESAEGQRKDLDMLIVLDRSGSMAGSLWDGTVAALGQFLGDPASQGVRAAMSFFPPEAAPDACDQNAYNPPEVPLAVLPTDAGTLTGAMAATTPAGDATPVYGALYGSLQWATLHQDANPDRVVVVVFASDGDPTECNTNIGVIAQVAATAYNYNGLRTYVVAIQGATVANLDTIAASGGTQQALDVTNDIMLFQEKMEEIRGEVLGCEFDIPQPMNDEFDPQKLNVEYAVDDMATPDTIPQVSDDAACGSDPGWYYDNPDSPTKIMLCPASCQGVQQNPTAIVTFAFGCPTVIK